MAERRVTAAGRRLRRHLIKMGMGVPAWCGRHGIEHQRITVQRIINGERYRAIPADTILMLQRAVRADGSELPTEDFASATAHPPA